MKPDRQPSTFCFTIPASKSELIRALLLRSFEPKLEIVGDSRCEDVEHVRCALRGLEQERKADRRAQGVDQADAHAALNLGDSGFGFRCLALRVSRLAHSEPVFLSGSQRLFSRPHDELWSALRQLGCTVSPQESQGVSQSLLPQGAGDQDSRAASGSCGVWITPAPGGNWGTDRLRISGARSSQFASAILLSAMGLEQEFTLVIEEPVRSRGYLDLTLRFLEHAGISSTVSVHPDRLEVVIPARSSPRADAVLRCEGDWSTAAGLLAVAAAQSGTRVELEGLSPESQQPDRAILEWLTRMGAAPEWRDGRLILERGPARLHGISVSGVGSPDLVPVFAALASCASGRSEVHSAPQLRHKESDRIRLAVRMAQFLGARAGETHDGFWIEPGEAPHPFRGTWSSDRDHRQVMAAFVALAAGAQFSIDDASVVAKSAPEFLEWMQQMDIQPKIPAWIFIGHRGTGKSALARRLSRRLGLECIDLDEEIEKTTGRTIPEIFEQEGEADFRQLEREQLRKWVTRELRPQGRIIVAGAGLDPQQDLREWRDWLSGTGFEVAWISRETDGQGRVFLDRPRLDRGISPLEEYRARAAARESRYRELSSRRVLLREGSDRLECASDDELSLVAGIPEVEGASITIPQWALADHSRLGDWLSLRRGWPFRFFEIREDLLPPGLTAGQSSKLLREFEFIQPERLLFSRRMRDPDAPLRSLAAVIRARGARMDWALELGDPPSSLEPGDFVSAHGPGTPLLEVPAGVTIKWSPVIENWSALRSGHQWWMKSVDSRVFFPRSPHGRWRYYRLLTARRFSPALNFLREDEGSAADQPTLLEWTANAGARESFGAVLGKPVFHSRSPELHGPHFHAYEIDVEEFAEAVEVLRELGIDHAAVTSPLKECAFQWAQAQGFELSTRAERLKSVNTLQWVRGPAGRADNTDLPGFERVLAELGITADTRVVLWGGGGTAAMVRELLPQVLEYSARTGQPREGTGSAKDSSSAPEVVIWGVGRSVFGGTFPPEAWRPRLVLDLNYAEDSPGREYAQRLTFMPAPSHGARSEYVSGLGLFEAQAAEQRRFWARA